MDLPAAHRRAREKGVNPFVYWPVRALFLPFFLTYFRLRRVGREHVPTEGPVIFASNHRSFLDPFIIGTLARRPTYYVAKKELFGNRLQAWFLNCLGAFPVDRGSSDEEMLTTARAILDRGDALAIFPEGTRIRPGGLGRPRRGVGRLALESGAAIVPVALIGTENVRTRWLIRPKKVSIRAGSPLRFPQVENPSKALAQAVTDRIWPCISLQWEWLGGTPPLRRAAIVGAGSCGTGLAALLARAGMEVQLGCRTAEQATALARTRVNERYLPGVALDGAIEVTRAADLDLAAADLVCFAVPARALPSAVAAAGPEIGDGTGVLVLSKGVVPPLGTLPSSFVSERVRAHAVAALAGPAHAAEALEHGAAVVVATQDRAFAKRLERVLGAAGLDVTRTRDVTGVELAACAKNAAALAAAAAGPERPNAAGAAAGKVFAEVAAYAQTRGGQPETFAGLAGAGDLVGTALAAGASWTTWAPLGRTSPDGERADRPTRRAGELLGNGTPAQEIGGFVGQAVEAVDSVPLLSGAIAEAGMKAPTLAGLSGVIEGRIAPGAWADGVTHAA